MVNRKFILTNVGNNNNKFWQVVQLSNTSYKTIWGRVGENGSETTFQCRNAESQIATKVGQKIKKGYREVKLAVADAPSVDLKTIAKQQIKTNSTEVSLLIEELAAENIHSILSNTSLTYDSSTANFSTPLGVVDRNTVSEARLRLSRIGAAIQKRLEDGQGIPLDEYTRLVEDYLMLIPTNLGRRKLNLKEIFPNMEAVDRQNTIIDGLDATLATPIQPSGNIETVFDCSLDLVQDSKTESYIEQLFLSTLNTQHVSRRLKVKRIFSVSLTTQLQTFQDAETKYGNIHRFWHGTRSPNLLSILKRGLVIPPANASYCTARMFGNGAYLSPQSTKSLNYSYGYWSGTRVQKCYMFLADVCLGRHYHPTYVIKSPPDGYDTIWVKGGTCGVINDEIIVFDTNQIKLVYLVEFAE